MLLIIYTDEYEKREMGMILLASAVNNKVRPMTQNKLMIRVKYIETARSA